jgi:hypothetical protein
MSYRSLNMAETFLNEYSEGCARMIKLALSPEIPPLRNVSAGNHLGPETYAGVSLRTLLIF